MSPDTILAVIAAVAEAVASGFAYQTERLRGMTAKQRETEIEREQVFTAPAAAILQVLSAELVKAIEKGAHP